MAPGAGVRPDFLQFGRRELIARQAEFGEIARAARIGGSCTAIGMSGQQGLSQPGANQPRDGWISAFRRTVGVSVVSRQVETATLTTILIFCVDFPT